MRTIIWDVDDVLNDLMRAWLDGAWNQQRPAGRVWYRDLRENPPCAVLGISPAEYFESLDRFRLSAAARDMEPNPDVLRWLEDHGAGFRHIALTARPVETAGCAAEWVFRHFGRWVRTCAVVPSRLEPGVPPYDRSKDEYLRWLGKGDVMIDDSVENLRAAARLGLRGVLYPRPWNGGAGSATEAMRRLTEAAGPK